MEPNAPVPTDKELQNLWQELYWEPGACNQPMIYRYAREVLSRWGNIIEVQSNCPTNPEQQPVSDW